MTAMRYGYDENYSSSKKPPQGMNIIRVLENARVDLLEVGPERNTVEYYTGHIPCPGENCFLGVEPAGIG